MISSSMDTDKNSYRYPADDWANTKAHVRIKRRNDAVHPTQNRDASDATREDGKLKFVVVAILCSVLCRLPFWMIFLPVIKDDNEKSPVKGGVN